MSLFVSSVTDNGGDGDGGGGGGDSGSDNLGAIIGAAVGVVVAIVVIVVIIVLCICCFQRRSVYRMSCMCMCRTITLLVLPQVLVHWVAILCFIQLPESLLVYGCDRIHVSLYISLQSDVLKITFSRTISLSTELFLLNQ